MPDRSYNYLSGLRLKKKRFIRKAWRISFVAGVVVVSLLTVWQHAQVIGLGYEVEELKKQGEELRKTNKALSIEAATLTSPERIESLARSRIGMVTAGDDQVVMVKKLSRGSGENISPARRVELPCPGGGRPGA